jgi:hypothetical protein
VYRNENDQKAGKQVFLKFFSVENRLRAFPKRENAFLTLIQGRVIGVSKKIFIEKIKENLKKYVSFDVSWALSKIHIHRIKARKKAFSRFGNARAIDFSPRKIPIKPCVFLRNFDHFRFNTHTPFSLNQGSIFTRRISYNLV